MSRVTLQLLLCAIFVAEAATADRDIVLLSGNPGKVSISDEFGTIFITDGNPSTFVFECFDDSSGDPLDIEEIGLSGTPSGTITISILPGDGHTFGARDVWKIDLTTTGVTGVIEEMNICGDLAEVSPGVDVDEVTGDITIGGLLLGDITADTLQDVTVSGVGTHNGSITTTANYHYTITIGFPETTSTINTNIDIPNFYGLANNQGGRFYFYGDMHGTIDVTYNWCGSMYLTGDLCNDITIGNDLGRVAHPSCSEGWGRDSFDPSGNPPSSAKPAHTPPLSPFPAACYPFPAYHPMRHPARSGAARRSARMRDMHTIFEIQTATPPRFRAFLASSPRPANPVQESHLALSIT